MQNGPVNRLLVICLDSADKDLIQKWTDENELVTFKNLFETAAWGYVKNPEGTEAGSLWPTFYTGVMPGRHGHYDDFKYFDAASYDYAFYQPSDMAFDPIWTILSRSNRRVAVIDTPYTQLDQNINGVHLMDWGSHFKGITGTGDIKSTPPQLAEEIVARFGSDPFGTQGCDSVRPRKAGFKKFGEALVDRVERKAALTAYILEKEDWDFALTVFSEPHCVGHQCWHLHDPSHPQHDESLREAIGDPIRDVYIAIDKALSGLLDRVNKDTNVIVLCSHGTGPFYSGSILLDQILLRIEGIAPPVKREWLVETLRRWWHLAPHTIRNTLMPVRNLILERRFTTTVRPKITSRKYFEIFNNNATGGVRVNLVGREAHGIVQPGAKFNAICDRLTKELLAIINVDTGEPLVEKIYRTSEVYDGEMVDHLPDLLVQWNRSGPIECVSSPSIGTVQKRHRTWRTGDHTNEGIVFGLGPSMVAGPIDGTISIADFAATIAGMLGVELPGVDGKPIHFGGKDGQPDKRAPKRKSAPAGSN